MKNHSSFKLAAILLLGAFFGLIITVIFNLMTSGRADKVILETTARIARHAIDCKSPQQSPLLKGEVSFLDESLTLNTALYGTEGHLLASYWGETSPAQVPLTYKQAQKYIDSFQGILIFGTGSWVQEQGICGKSWTLVLNDPQNLAFRTLIFRRQASLFTLTSASLIGMIMIFWMYLSRKGAEATRVLKDFSTGQLNSRLSVSRWENSFELLQEFNRMAEQVSLLIEKIRSLEEKRSQLLSELAHDTRTPIASLMSSLDTLGEFGDTLNSNQREKLSQNIREDLEYFARLVEDLFFLAHIDSQAPEDFKDVIEVNELAKYCWRLVFESCDRLSLNLNCNGKFQVLGDETLLRRMILNFLENAKRYSHKEVQGTISQEGDKVLIVFENDGNALSENELQSWGHKQKRRTIHDESSNPHIGLGLGSSIACRVAEAHGGSAKISQKEGPKGALIRVEVTLPLRT